MNAFSYVLMGAFLVNYTLWVLMFVRLRPNPIATSFFWYVGTLSGFILFEFIGWVSEPGLALIWQRLDAPFWIFIGGLFLNFVYAILGKSRDKWLTGLLVASGLASVLAVLTPWVIRMPQAYYWGYGFIPGILFHPVVLLLVVFPVMAGIFLLFERYQKTEHPQLRCQYRLIMIGTALSLAVGVVTDIVLPYYLRVDDFVRFAAMGTVFQSFFIFIAVRRCHFMTEAASDA